MSRRAAIVAVLWLLPVAEAARAEPLDFDRDVAPILIDHCLACHYPSKKNGGLDFTSAKTLLTGGDQGPTLVAGKPNESLLLARITAKEMPPPEEKGTRPLSSEQIETLRDWIATGANWPESRELGIHEQSINLDAARTFWSFQPVRRPPIPTLRAPGSEFRTAIDAFITKKLAAASLSLSPPASRADIHRRLSLDLRGVPPTLEEQKQFLADDSPDAYERLVDRLLADPAYGERWARHWLDLVRYADSNGYERDGPKPSVWRYRDYVIAALNSDKPYNRFVMEQIAGDELPDATDETMIATGFHALGAWNDEVDPLEAPQYRADELDDMIRTTSQTFLGLTLGCARCHNHKFDPLTMADYYSLSAILAPLKRPNLGRTDRDLPLGTPEQIAALAKRNEAIAELEKKIAELAKSKPADLEQQVAVLRSQQAQLRAATPDLPRTYRCYEDSPTAPPTHLLLSGRASNPGPVMQPRVPAILANRQPDFSASVSPSPTRPLSHSSTGRRLVFAHWLASADNPLTARVMVNRVWQHHFGEGIVVTPSDFGHMGARPTHPELLDWLADWFTHDADWSLKRLHRQVVTSETYRQRSSAERRTRNGELSDASSVDPENRLLSHFPYRRLDVEAIRDSMLAVAGNMNEQMYGPAVFLPIPAAAVEAHTDKEAAWKVQGEPDIDRRTVYAYVKRTLLVPMLETLDFCDTTSSTDKRAITSIAPQALTLYNGEFTSCQAAKFAERLTREAGDGPSRQITLAYRLALCREPTERELATMRAFLAQEATATDRQQALVQLCRVILNLNEFVYPN